MKEGWEYKKLGEVCEILDSRRKPITKNKRESGTIPYYGATGILDYVKDYIFDEKLVLLGEDGAKWGAGENSAYIVEGKTWVNNHAHALRPKRDLLKDELLVYYLNFSNLLPYITGVTVPKLNQEKMRSIEIPIGPISEQQSIVDYLDSAFAKIDAMKANAEKRLNEAQALFQASLKEMLEPKEGWEEKSMKEIVHPDCSLSYGIVQPGEHIDDGVPVVRPVDFNNKVIVRVEGLKRTKKEISDAYKRTILKGGEILLCVRGTTGTMGLASDELQGCNVTRGIVPIFFDEHANKMFVYYQLLSPKLQTEIQKKTTGAALKQINIKDLRALHLFFPSLSEQQAIVETLDSLKSKVDRLQANYEKISQECDALKQAILRQVFE